jgi:hypothetical protein
MFSKLAGLVKFFLDDMESLSLLSPFMVRQAHHERTQQVIVRPELVEGINKRFLNRKHQFSRHKKTLVNN